LRAPGLARAEYAALAAEALVLCRQHGAQLLLNCPVELALALDADGIHLNSRQLAGLSERPLTDDRWVAASCHNREEVLQAMAIDADFCVLSPVLPTTSHPTAAPLGWERFSQIVAATNIPVYALGGMDEDQIEVALEHGGQGIAAITALWAGESP
jgi:thiamine-phosphate diphosphorylase